MHITIRLKCHHPFAFNCFRFVWNLLRLSSVNFALFSNSCNVESKRFISSDISLLIDLSIENKIFFFLD